MATVFFPCWAIPVAMLALVVVLPTPPLPEVTTTTLDGFDKGCLLDAAVLRPDSIQRAFAGTAKFFTQIFHGADRAGSQLRDPALLVLEEDLHGAPAQAGGDL